MRSATVLLLATSVFCVAAEPTLVDREPTVVERDLPTVTSILSQVGSGIATLDQAVNSFTGDPSTVNSATAALLSTFQSGTTTVQGTSNLSLTDAVSLQSIATNLQTQGNTLVNDLASKKTAFEAAGLCGAVQQQVNQLQTGSTALINAVVAKVPQEAQGIASSLTAGFTQTFQQAGTDFSTGNCTNTGAGSGSSSGSSSGATTGASTVPSTSSASATGTATGVTSATTPKTTTGSSSGNGTATKTTAAPTQFTAAAVANGAIGPIGVLAIAAAALVL